MLGYHLSGSDKNKSNPNPVPEKADNSSLKDFVASYKQFLTANPDSSPQHPCSCDGSNDDVHAAETVSLDIPIACLRFDPTKRYKTSSWVPGLDHMASGQTPTFFRTEKMTMHNIVSNIDKVKNSLLPIAGIKKFYTPVTEQDTGKHTRAGAALRRGEDKEVAFFNGRQIDTSSLTMGTSDDSSNKILVFADKSNILRRNNLLSGKKPKPVWAYVKVKEVLTDAEIVAIGKLSGEISPPLQIYFLLVACKYKQYIMENREKELKRGGGQDAWTNTLVPRFEELIKHIRDAIIDIPEPKMEILRLTWEDWVTGDHDYASHSFHIAVIMLVSGGKADETCRQAYTNLMHGMRGPKELLLLMKADGGRTLSLCGLTMALTEALRSTSLYLSGSISLLNAAALSCLYFGGSFPTNEIHATSMEQFLHKKCRIILNSITPIFNGVGCDLHVLGLVKVLAKHLNVGNGLNDDQINHNVCDKKHINEEVGYYANEIVGQLKQWSNSSQDSKEKFVCRKIVEQIVKKDSFLGLALQEFLKLGTG